MNKHGSKRSNPIAAKAAPTVFVLACALILAWASLRANAAWHFLAAKSIAESIHQAERPDPARLALAQDHLDRALARFSDNPDYLDLGGYLLQREAHQPGVVGEERRELLEIAAANYRAALTSRPRWPYGWANILSLKDKLGQVDSEFILALRRAVELGPWEPRVQLAVIRSGVRHWEALRSQERQLVRGTVDDALRVQPRAVYNIARFYARPELVCHAGDEYAPIGRWCGNVL